MGTRQKKSKEKLEKHFETKMTAPRESERDLGKQM